MKSSKYHLLLGIFSVLSSLHATDWHEQATSAQQEISSNKEILEKTICKQIICKQMSSNQTLLLNIKEHLNIIKEQMPTLEKLYNEFEGVINSYQACSENIINDLSIQTNENLNLAHEYSLLESTNASLQQDKLACTQAYESLTLENTQLSSVNECLSKENNLLKTIQDLLQQHNELLKEKASNLNCEYQTNLAKIHSAVIQLKEHYDENSKDQQSFVEYIKQLLEKSEEDDYDFINKLHNLCMFDIID